MKLIEDFYLALQNKDKEKLFDCVDKTLFQANIQHTHQFPNIDAFTTYFFTKFTDYKVIDITQYGAKYYTRFATGGKQYAAKFTIKNGNIVHYYQMPDDGRNRIKMSLSYNGHMYHGFQKQNHHVTIQSVIEKTLKEALKESIKVVSSGRTDRHVNAIAQVIHFDTSSLMPIEKYQYIINAILPDDIYAYNIMNVPKAFHARFDVQQKEYLYKLNTGPYDATLTHNEWFIGSVNFDHLKNILNDVIGTHDFYGFSKRPQTTNTIRTVDEIHVHQVTQHKIHIIIKAKGFLRHMVRYIVGASVMIAQGKVDYALKDVFDERDNEIIKTLANPSGLYLNKVFYEDSNDSIETINI
ncbi:MAG: tRNA pseudouridine(38-40) synthase TruA [Candidatus Izemoplasma sp.]|nr:tRNA pseudouridine(38-40) synthase TruA [Candidatus Izemoplasma sp.]